MEPSSLEILPSAKRYGWVEKLGSEKKDGKSSRATKLISLVKRKRVWRKYFMILHCRVLYLYKDDMASCPDYIINLERYHSVTRDFDKYGDKFCFRLLSFGSERIQYISVSSDEDLKAWMDLIKPALSSPKEEEQKFLDMVEKGTETKSVKSDAPKRSSLRARLKNFRKRHNRLSAALTIASEGSFGEDSDGDAGSEDESDANYSETEPSPSSAASVPVSVSYDSVKKSNLSSLAVKDEGRSLEPIPKSSKISYPVPKSADEIFKAKKKLNRSPVFIVLLILFAIGVLYAKFVGFKQ
ncbi:hypothetical protein MP638_001230 [Amoeboaphelidium occidentale]|nr:hypothetical protein MP638_001230 [Amoeboaphelidium occidentale]